MKTLQSFLSKLYNRGGLTKDKFSYYETNKVKAARARGLPKIHNCISAFPNLNISLTPLVHLIICSKILSKLIVSSVHQ